MNKDELDDFWDISKLAPTKKSALSTFSKKDVTAEVIIPSEEKNPPVDGRLSFEGYEKPKAAVTEFTYKPSDNRLIESVTIKPSIDRFDFYDTFRKAALIYFDYKSDACEFEPFYSYKPQYSQMNQEQKRYYFYWRDLVRRGKYIKTDYSYISLFVYEILNLPDKIEKEEGLGLLCSLWRAYRKDMPRIDASFTVWVQDYCLVYQLPCPTEKISDFLFDAISASSFKEFYISDIDAAGDGASAMIAYLSDYDWREGKYASADNADTYKTHIEGAMRAVFSRLWKSSELYTARTVKTVRTAFPGALCTHSVKCVLELEYRPISESAELRKKVTAALRYTENKLRATIGVKSRLAVKELPDDCKRVIDTYFEEVFAKINRERARANAPAYERLYDAPTEELSFDDAVELEKASWRVTARLVEQADIGDGEYVTLNEAISADNTADTVMPKIEALKNEDDTYGLSDTEITLLSALSEGNISKAKTISDEGCGFSELYERINEAFFDNFGDVVLEESDDGFIKIIDDYCEEIKEWIRNLPR